MTMGWRDLARWLAALAFAGCGPMVGHVANEGTTTSASASTTPATGTTQAPQTTTAPNMDASTTSSDDGGTDTGGDPWDCAFLCAPDVAPAIDCDVWAQDCPRGQKCMPWAHDGGNSWNATRCTPIADDPKQPGESCTVEGSSVSGIDDCERAAMCFAIDPETNTGTCYGFCRGSEANPTCVDPATECRIWNEGVLILCYPHCDPIAQDCDEGLLCVPSEGWFVCAPDPANEGGVYGDPCEFINGCDPGLFCDEVVDDVEGCTGTIGCCNSFCDLSVDDPHAECPDALQGPTCTAWFEPGETPPGLAHVGRCAVPR